MKIIKQLLLGLKSIKVYKFEVKKDEVLEHPERILLRRI